MNLLIARSLFIVLLSFSYLHGTIFESSAISDILPHIDKNTLVIFDLDDTLIRTPGMLGSDSWFRHNVKQQMKNGLSFDDAAQTVLPLFFVIHTAIKLELVDARSRALITDLQQRGLKIIGLTNRSPFLTERTKHELNRLGIDFSVGALCKDELTLSITHTGRYSKGIIFCANNNKGEMLLLFLDHVGHKPSKIVFVDDKRRYLEHVGTAAQSRGISFVGMRYAGSDTRKKQFDPLQAERELLEFKCTIGIAPLEKKEKNEVGKYHSTCAQY